VSTLLGDEAKRSLTDHGGGCGAEKCDEGEHGDLADERGHRLEHQHRVHVQVLQCMRFKEHKVSPALSIQSSSEKMGSEATTKNKLASNTF
jgi:hypothetical protein